MGFEIDPLASRGVTQLDFRSIVSDPGTVEIVTMRDVAELMRARVPQWILVEGRLYESDARTGRRLRQVFPLSAEQGILMSRARRSAYVGQRARRFRDLDIVPQCTRGLAAASGSDHSDTEDDGSGDDDATSLDPQGCGGDWDTEKGSCDA